MKLPLFLFASILLSFSLFSQEKELRPISVEADLFYGNIMEHNPQIEHLITGHPTGFFASLNYKTYGFNEWERRYNYPDWGFTMAYQDMQNEYLGDVVGVYGHINWYFLNRHLMFRAGQGIAYASNPFDAETNFQNNAYGTRFLSTTFLKGNFVRENIWKGLGVHAGFTIIHYSNGNLKADRKSVV